MLDEPLVQPPPRRGVRDVRRAREDGDRSGGDRRGAYVAGGGIHGAQRLALDTRSCLLERADVGGRVDAEGHAGHDRHAGGGEPAAERAGDLEPIWRAAPRADDRDAFVPRQSIRPTGDVQHRGRVDQLAQPLRVAFRATAHGGQPRADYPCPRTAGREACVSQCDAARGVEREQRVVGQ